MPDKSNNLVKFWNELKRRKVFRVIAMYAATAFILLEVVDIVAPSLGLPSWTLNLVIVLLCIGFPISVILAWIFDITPEGLKKTEPTKVAKQKGKPSEPVKRRLRVSDVIIALLVVIVVILAYPKIFRKDKFEGIRDTDGRISIAVMPFQNMTGDTIWNIWQDGIQNELITNLSNSTELSVRHYQTMHDILQSKEHTNYASITPLVASDISRKLEANSFILGSIKKSGDIVRINAQLIDSETEEIYKTYQIAGNTEDDIFNMTDSLSKLVRGFLEIKVLKQDVDYDIHKFITTNSAEAYRSYIQGVNLFSGNDFSSSINLFNKTLEIDTNFIATRIFLVLAFHNLGMHEEAKLCLQKGYKQLENVPYDGQLLLKFCKSMYDKDPHVGIKHIGLFLEDYSQSRFAWYQQGFNYSQIYQHEKAIKAYEKALEIDRNWGGGWKWVSSYIGLGEAYHEIGQHTKEKEIYELGLSVLPDHPRIIYQQAICAFSQGETTAANDYIAKYKLICETKYGWGEYRINFWIGTIYQEAKQFNKAIGIFRELISIDPQDPRSKWQLGFILIDNEINIDEGMELIDQALEIEPDNYSFLDTRGWGLYKQGRLEEALKVLNDSWDLRPLYSHEGYQHIREVERALANQGN